MACTDPQEMLDFLDNGRKPSERKFRLFACACCRRVWTHLRDNRSRKALEVSERYADGQASDQELLESHDEATTASEIAESAFRRGEVDAITVNATVAISRGTAIGESARRVNPDEWWVVRQGDDVVPSARAASRFAALASTDVDKRFSDVSHKAECAAQTVLIRCIFGNPFKPAPTIGRAQLAWNERTVVRLARSAYDERHVPTGTLDNARLAVLADALEEAGFSDVDMLAHLRSPGPHVRGCWPVDCCLGKS